MMRTRLEPEGIEYECEADAGVFLGDGERWWGTRVRYRASRSSHARWTKFLLVDVHPFDVETVETAVRAHSQGRTAVHV